MNKAKKTNKSGKSVLDLSEKLDEFNQQYDHKDDFLGKDILTLANRVDAARNNMWHGHEEQRVVLEKPERPRMFTRYETLVGKYSSAYKQAEQDYDIIAKINKFEGSNTNYILVIKYKNSNYYDIIERKECEKLTESYCYPINNEYIDSLNEGDTVKKDDILFKSTSFDKDMNYNYGVNANIIFVSDNKTTEDAIKARRGFLEEKCNSFYCDEILITINTNDILINYYGDNEHYKSFPDIDEYTKDDRKILAVRRRINYETSLYDLKDEQLMRINYNDDQPFYGKGKVIDIDIYCNQDPNKLRNYEYNSQIVKYLDMQTEYYKKIVEILEPIKFNTKNKCSDDLSYLYRRAKDILNPEITWKNDKSDFDNIVLVFKVMKIKKATIGSKFAGRYGR